MVKKIKWDEYVYLWRYRAEGNGCTNLFLMPHQDTERKVIQDDGDMKETSSGVIRRPIETVFADPNAC